ncbi:MAG: hypothetical protein Q8N99_01915 [Nanoarchaeota archaeon]|nr:hypothetical protein [Nanoarchaeota archaeon]
MALVETFSGIRGIYKLELTEEIIEKYARAFLYFLKEIRKIENPKIVIGRDTRPSGKEVFNVLIKSLNCEIIDVGISTTPIIEHAVRIFGCDGGIIITASHNGPEYN